jgi:hypothetical protein
VPPGGPAAPTRDIGVPDLLWATEDSAPIADWWETTSDLLWPQSLVTFGRMRHDPQIKAVLNAYFYPLLRATWAVDPAGVKDQVASHVADDLGLPILGADAKPGPARRRGLIWHRHLEAALDHLVYGHAPFELRYRIDSTSPGGAHLDHLGERLPHTIASMKVNRDGTLAEIKQNTQDAPIPANRLLWYVTGKRGSNWAGTSVLRPAFAPWLIKHEMWRVHGTSIRRFGMGVPYVEAPPGGTAAQVAEAQAMASAMRAGEQAGMGLPAGFKPGLLGMSGGAPDALAFIEYLDRAVAKMALAGLIELGQTETGSRALGETFLDLFLLALQAVADEVATTVTSGQDGTPGAVVDLVTVNWGEDEPAPRIVCTDVGTNYQLAADAIQALMASGALTADPNLEKWVRETWRLPERDKNAPGPPAAPAAPGGIAQRVAPGQPPPGPGAPAGQPPPAPARPSPGGQVAASAAPPGLRRGYTEVEERSGFDAAAHDAAWVSAREALAGVYRDVLRGQRNAVVDQVTAAVAAGKVDRLAGVMPDTAQGGQVIAAAMTITARHAAAEVVAEAAHQGVVINPGSVHLDEAGLARQGRMWAQTIATRMVQAAAVRAATIVAPGPGEHQAVQIGDQVDAALGEMSDSRLADELGAAISAAQNAGRLAAFAAAPPGATYVASEILDKSTCEPCRSNDGAVYATLLQAGSAYPAGHYRWCKGQMRCRGTVVAVFAEAPGQVAAAAWREELHPRGQGGQFAHSPSRGAVMSESGGADDWGNDFAPLPRDTYMPPLKAAPGVKALTSPGRPDGRGTPDDPIDVQGDIDRALVLLSEGKHVRLNQPQEVALLLDRVDVLARKTLGKSPPPVWDFGKLTVTGTNLFAAEHKGIPRVSMPQFSGVAQPGSEAARVAGGAGRVADMGKAFAARLRADGVTLRRTRVRADHLRASQMELNGAKIASFVHTARDASAPRHAEALAKLGEPIYVTRDHYVIDGHHRWAANMCLDAADGVLGDVDQQVTEIDMDIGAAIPYALAFAESVGIATKSVSAAFALLSAAMGELDAAAWDESEHPRDPAGRFTLGMHVRVTSGYHEGVTGHVTRKVGGGMLAITPEGGGHEVVTGAHVVEPTGQPGIHVEPPPPEPEKFKPKIGDLVNVGFRNGTIVRFQRGPHSIPGAVVQFDDWQHDPSSGYLPSWVPLTQLGPPKPKPGGGR